MRNYFVSSLSQRLVLCPRLTIFIRFVEIFGMRRGGALQDFVERFCITDMDVGAYRRFSVEEYRLDFV